MDRLNRSSINMISSLIGYAVPMVINLVVIPILLSALGETAYGLQSLVAVIIGYLTVMDMGLDYPITKYLAEDHAKKDTESANRMLNNSLQLYLIIGVIGMALIFFAAEMLAYKVFKVPGEMVSEAIVVFQLAGIGFLGSVGMSWGRSVAMGLQRFEITYGVAVLTNLAGVCLGLMIVYAGYGVSGYVLMRVISTVVAGVAYWILARWLLPFYHLQLGFDFATLRRVRGYIGYGLINRVLGSVVSRLDQTFIAIWLGVAAAGIYSIPFNIMTSLGYMIAYMLGFMFPLASELHSLGQLEILQDIYIRSTRFITALSSMIFIPLIVFGDLFMTLWVGTSAGEQTRYVIILIALSGYIGTFSVTLPNSIAIGTGRIKQFTIYNTIRGVVLGTGCFLLIKPMGLEGAGAALLVSNIVELFFLVFVSKCYLHISPFELFRSAHLPPIALGLALVILTIFLRPFAHSWIGLITTIGIFEVLYILIGYKMGVFGETEKRVIQNYISFLSRLCLDKKSS